MGFNSGFKGLMKIRPVRAELFHADGHDEARSHIAQFCKIFTGLSQIQVLRYQLVNV